MGKENSLRADHDEHYCLDLVRRDEKDYFLCALFLPVQQRRSIAALLAFDCEINRAIYRVNEPILGHIRLQWWDDSLAQLEEQPPRTPVIAVLAALVKRGEVSVATLRDHLALRRLELELLPYDGLAQARLRIEARTKLALAFPFGQDAAPQGLISVAARAHATVKAILADPNRGAGTELAPEERRELLAEASLMFTELRVSFTKRQRRVTFSLLLAALADLQSRRLEKQLEGAGAIQSVPVYRRQFALLRAVITGRIPR
jgi:hypothetical protein